MAVAEDAGAKFGGSSEDLEKSVVSSDSNAPNEEVEKPKPRNGSVGNGVEADQNLNGVDGVPTTVSIPNGNHKPQISGQMQAGLETNGGFRVGHQMVNGVRNGGEDGGESFKREMRDLAELLSKLNPMAEEFVPSSLAKNHGYLPGGFGFPNNLLLPANFGNANGQPNRRRKNGYNNRGKQRANHKIEMERREEMIRRTVYVSDIDQQV
ncbi:Poly(A) RNA polymerase cid13, partial [Stylosanthes scabra]|nr:Poly(A) RNA polymerase cid13 [Stylosanthes scabra]